MSLRQVRRFDCVPRLHSCKFSVVVSLHGRNLFLQRFDTFVPSSDLVLQLADLLLYPFDFRRSDHRPDTVKDGRTDLSSIVFQSLSFQLAFYRVQFGRGSMQFCSCRLFLLRSMFDGFALLLLDAEQFADIVLQVLLSGNGVAIKLLRRKMSGFRAVDTSL